MTLFGLGHVFSLSVFTVNIALLLGLCLSLDYALLIINRFRDELRRGHSAAEAVAITQTTAGKSVFFSGLAVFVSLSALLLFPINVLFSVGIGGLAAIFVSVSMAIVVLPALLGILSKNINRLPIRIFKQKDPNAHSFWRRIIIKVLKRPVLNLIFVLALLLICGYPILHVNVDISDFRILPPTQQSRQVFDTFESKFGESKLSPIIVLVKSKSNDILTKSNIGEMYRFGTKLANNPYIDQVTSIVNTTPRLSKEQYEMLYTQPASRLPAEVKKLLRITTHGELTTFTVISKYPSHTEQTNNLILDLRKMNPGKNFTIEVTGTTANTIDVMKSISDRFLYAFLWIICFTYLVLLIFLRSIILPLKAIITTILSLCASYGVLVLVIQEGYLHNLLRFEPQGMLDISLLIISSALCLVCLWIMKCFY